MLVAVRGSAVYQAGFGAANLLTGERFTPATVSYLGSASKPFTAMAVMMLAEEGRLSYDDNLASYFPELPPAYGSVTLRNLLTMTSGIRDYADLVADHPGLTNAEVLRALRQSPTLAFPPGEKFAASNSNYVLLALLVERVTGTPFPAHLKRAIFDRLGMASTFVYTSPRQKTAGVAIGYTEGGKPDDYVSHTTGDGGVYSNVGDLLKWDQALALGLLVRPPTQALAFTPAVPRRGPSSYGFGWNITQNRHGTSVWEAGETGSFQAYLHRGLTEQTTVIMLTDGGSSDRAHLAAEIIDLLSAADRSPVKLASERRPPSEVFSDEQPSS